MEFASPRQVARAIGVSESSLKRWCDRGWIAASKTAGGHRRLAVASVVEYLRASQRPVLRPELLGLPPLAPPSEAAQARSFEETTEIFANALLAGDEESCRRLLLDLHLAGVRVSGMCDNVIAAAFRRIGDLWQCGTAQVFHERRACEVCLRVLTELRRLIPAGAVTAPLAIGGTPEVDPYMLPTAMVEIVLRQSGWRSQSLGSRLPMSTLLAAIEELRPQIFWLSVSHLEDEARFLSEYRDFYRHVGSQVAVVVGGRALTEPVRREMEYAAYCDNLQHLESFAATIKRSLSASEKESAASAAEPPKESTSRLKPLTN